MTRDVIFSWTQAALALIVVVGSGVLLALSVVSSELVTAVIGMVLGYYFGTANAPAPLNGRTRARGKDTTE